MHKHDIMKKGVLVIAVLLFAVSLKAQFSKASLQATGLTCSMCSNAVNRALQKVSFVESVKSDIKNSSFEIVFRNNTEVSPDALKDAVEDAGFSVGSLKLTGSFNGLGIENNKHVKIGKQYFHFLQVNNQVLNGEKTITVMDKNFVTEKMFKKYSNATRVSCEQTIKTDSGERLYHVTI